MDLSGARKMSDIEMIRHFRAMFRRQEIYVEKRKGNDRRIAFMSFLADDRRQGERRNKPCYATLHRR